MIGERHFVIEQSDIGFKGGLYKASVPYNAGKKAARILFSKAMKQPEYSKYAGVKKIKFVLRETNTEKSFAYEATMTKLAEPKVVSRNGVDITIEKEIKIKSCKYEQ